MAKRRVSKVEAGLTAPEGKGKVPSAPSPVTLVGVGASAGGLEAITALLGHLELDRLALVVVQHLDPRFLSQLTDILGRATASRVVTAEEGMLAASGHVYVIPPNTELTLRDGLLHLTDPPLQALPRLPIDAFLRSLAVEQGPRAVGIVLSGTGADGTLGLKAIKAAGGLTFAQDPLTAKYDGMPRHAIEAGWVDLVLAPELIGRELTRLGRMPSLGHPVPGPSRPPDDLMRLLGLIRAAFGTDLSAYKPSTLERRLERRMLLQKIERLEDYLAFVEGHPAELRAIYKDMLIGVTAFFRDPEPFELLCSKIFPQLIEAKENGASIRIWVPACATGEECYSIAICLLEAVADRRKEAGDRVPADLRIQIFGTDIDDDAVKFARHGIYPASIEQEVSPERLKRFFVKHDAGYQLARRVRELVVFSAQNLIKDPPFSRMDLISCRNLLIYLQPVLQQRVLRQLHYALQPGGTLLLGSSETVTEARPLFETLHRGNHFYSKKEVAPGLLPMTAFVPPLAAPPPTGFAAGQWGRRGTNFQQLADRKVLERFGPPGVVVNELFEILQFRGRTAAYLESAPGAPTLNLFKLARPELVPVLREVTRRALAEQVPARGRAILQRPGEPDHPREDRPLGIEALPLAAQGLSGHSLLVLFHERPAPEPDPQPPPEASIAGSESAEHALTVDARRELERTKEALQSMEEEFEAVNDELSAANEELQSANEELQSSNEELETSKAELQSTNEELTTVNEELVNRMAELGHSNEDLHNIMEGVESAVIMVGRDLRLRRFTAAAERTLKLVAVDAGRPASYLDAFLGFAIEPLLLEVIEHGVPVTRELQASDRRWYELQISAFKTESQVVEGAVVMLLDIDARMRVLALRRELDGYAKIFLHAFPQPLLVLDAKLRVAWVNQPFLIYFQVASEEIVGFAFADLGSRAWGTSELLAKLGATLATGAPFRDLEVPSPFPRLAGAAADRPLHLAGSRIVGLGPEGSVLLLSFDLPPR